jgi:hypothetical protein
MVFSEVCMEEIYIPLLFHKYKQYTTHKPPRYSRTKYEKGKERNGKRGALVFVSTCGDLFFLILILFCVNPHT